MENGKKKILIHSLVFSPDGVSTAYLYNDIALAFKKAGYSVVVLSTTPHFNKIKELCKEQPLKWGCWGLYKRSSFNGIPVIHIPQKKFKSTILRLIGFLYWHIIAFIIGLGIKNIDAILSPSPPLTIGLINLWLGRIKHCKVVYNVQEIYPDILGKDHGLSYRILSLIERKIYNKSDAVTTIDNVFYNNIVDRFNDSNKLYIIPNFVDTELYHSHISTDILDNRIFHKTDSLKLLYAGNIGFAQDWETLIRLVQKTVDLGIEFFVIGEGVKKTEIEECKRKLKLEKLHILPYQPRYMMPAILAYSDIQFIFMSQEMEMQGFPSKVYTIMACGRPLLVASGNGTPIVNFLTPFHCSKLITDYDIEEKTDKMVQWLSRVSKEELRNMGYAGEKIIKEHYSKEIVTKQYVDLIDSIL